ncbi:tetrahydrofolate synthase [Segatella salivae]|uniref:tetrahydrofolate synthase n=1 Tax=Segatella salivae TaxID=228604 RepID=UPI00241BFF93|nr:tetrahydrofolate synthase [Segatella salivae]
MNVSAILNVITMQRRRYCTIIPMNAFAIANVTTTQLGTSCSFDSPGLARNEPPLGNHPQGDSMLYALRLLGEHIVFVSSCVSILGPTP